MAADAGASLRRGIAVLFALEADAADGRRGLGVTQIAQRIDRDKSQVSRTLKILTEYGLVERDPDTLAYRLGWRLFTLAARGGASRLLVEARPFLRRLVQELGETAHLSILQGPEVVTLLSEAPPHAVRASGWVGRTVPAHCTSSGRALLFEHRGADIAALFSAADRRRGGPKAPRTADELAERVSAACAAGYAVVEEEFEVDLVAVGAPVRDFRGQIVAAVNVSGPKFRFGRRLRAAGETVRAGADELSTRLGQGGEEQRATASAGSRPGVARKPTRAVRVETTGDSAAKRIRLTPVGHRAITGPPSSEGA